MLVEMMYVNYLYVKKYVEMKGKRLFREGLKHNRLFKSALCAD